MHFRLDVRAAISEDCYINNFRCDLFTCTRVRCTHLLILKKEGETFEPFFKWKSSLNVKSVRSYLRSLCVMCINHY